MPGKHYGKKSSGFKMGGMSFMTGSKIGGNMGLNRMRNGYQGNPSAFPKDDKFTKSNPNRRNPEDGARVNPSTIDKEVTLPKRQPTGITTNKTNTKLTPTDSAVKPTSTDSTVKSKDSKWSKTKSGHDVKTRRYKNLLGREREVKKYYDKETGKKLGKQVTVDRAKGDPRAKKQKIKKVNPGLTQSGGVGKIRLKENPWDTNGSTGGLVGDNAKGKMARPEYASTKPELKEFVKTDDAGKKTLSSYDQAWDDGRFTTKGGKRTDKFGNVYSDDEAGKQKFIQASKDWWSKQASDTGNEDLLIDSQTGKKQSSMKKKRGYKMKGSPFNIYSKPKGKRTEY